MPKAPRQPAGRNRAAKRMNGLKSSAVSTLNRFQAAAAGGSASAQGAPAAADLAERVAAQIGLLFEELEAAAAAAGEDIQREFDAIMRILDPEKLLETFARFINEISEAAGKMWIKLLQEIKKLIRVLWELFFGKLPRWLETILLLIDELAKHAVESLFPKLGTELSAGEVAYLREVHAARRITLLEERGGASEED